MPNRIQPLTASVLVLLSVGCTPMRPKTQQVAHDPLLGRKQGALLLVDVCVQRDGIGKGDYFVTEEAEAGGKEALAALGKYVKDSDIPVREEVISVCGTRLSPSQAPITAADHVGAPKHQAQQPLRITGPRVEDAEYVRALGVVSTYTFERAALPAERKRFEGGGPAPDIQMDEFARAARVIQRKTQASTILFLGILGTSVSGGKAAAQFIGSMIVGVGTAIATAGLGTGFYLVFTPGHQIDGMIMEGALVDLESGALTWSNAVRVGGDPVRPKAMANPDALNLLFHGLMFQPVTNSIATGTTP